MSAQSSIEWTDATWNPTRGCRKISPGCKHCYAEVLAERFRGVKGHPYEQGFDPRLAPDMLDAPLHWKKPRMVFVNSMSDLFFDEFPNEYIAAVFGVMAACPQHTFQVLTKRASRLPEWFAWIQKNRPTAPQSVMHEAIKSWMGYDNPLRPAINEHRWPLPNAWIGVSVEDQQRADERIPELLKVPAAVRFLSCEPLLGPVDLSRWIRRCPTCRGRGFIDEEHDFGATERLGCPSCCGGSEGIHWVIVGGESGGGARPMRIEWARSIVEQCKAAGVSCFTKQWGDKPLGEAGQPIKLRTKKGGDPREWAGAWPREFPNAT